MSNQGDELEGLTPEERALAERLVELGPLIVEQNAALAELSPEAAARLRASIVDSSSPSPRWRYLRNRPAVVGTVAAVALIAVVLSLLLRPTAPFHPPVPTQADLRQNLPVPVFSHARSVFSINALHPRGGNLFNGHLRLQGSPPAVPMQRRAYRLAVPHNVVPVGKRFLGIGGRPRRIRANHQMWVVAEAGTAGSRSRLHSLAVSVNTGELIYHDRRTFNLRLAHAPASRRHAIGIARTWLIRLGWPGTALRLRSVERVGPRRDIRQVVFNWPQTHAATIAEATLWVTPNGSVVEVWAWPWVSKATPVGVRTPASAWDIAQRGSVPVAVLRRVEGTFGRGRLASSSVVSLLVPRGSGAYLVPGYRFRGRATIGRRKTPWLALVPGTQ